MNATVSRLGLLVKQPGGKFSVKALWIEEAFNFMFCREFLRINKKSRTGIGRTKCDIIRIIIVIRLPLVTFMKIVHTA